MSKSIDVGLLLIVMTAVSISKTTQHYDPATCDYATVERVDVIPSFECEFFALVGNVSIAYSWCY